MGERVRITATNGLRLRDSPRDGVTLQIIAPQEKVEVLGRETWLRVKYGGRVGFVLADYVEAAESEASPIDTIVQIIELPATDVFKGAALRIDKEFESAVRDVESLARHLKLQLWITSSLREPYQPVTNTLAPPARMSNHHVGHGFDMNILSGNNWFRSEQLGSFQSLPTDVRNFIDGVRRLGLRWGGDFLPVDPVHIDDNLNHRDPAAFDRKLRAIWGFPPSNARARV